MKRLLTAGAMFLASGLAITALRAETIRYHDAGGADVHIVDGSITEEGPAGVTIKTAVGKVQKIPAQNIVDVEYPLPSSLKREYLQAAIEERTVEQSNAPDRGKQLVDARKRYRALIADTASPVLKRHLQWKVARLTALLAEGGDAKELSAAITALKQYKTDNSDSWEITPCCLLLGELQTAGQKYAEAQKTYEDLAAIPSVPKTVKQDCNLRIAELLVRQKKYADARTRVNELIQATPANDPQMPRLKIAQAECQAAGGDFDPAVKTLQEIIRQPLDEAVKAHAYNILGECYYSKERYKDALWNYLYVDVIYNHNREEHARALYYLNRVFKKLGDAKRAAQYAKRLDTLAGTEYQKRRALEPKASSS